MSGGFVPRFALEIAFLALLALAAGLAELATGWIVAVMAAGWLLVVLVEWLAWRAETGEGGRAAGGADDQAGDEDAWDLEEILAPLPEDDRP